ncbi:MAG: hypothetical protein A2075_10120 [Geobacteraceae bacterium GWC2_58_44]|nr:MAG: hypothetical protein A2075_10120 [Geobacteraceae bacterium GWC2_58_44]HBG06661.1 DUF4124 domain-containing protein [Geobacter sp.]
MKGFLLALLVLLHAAAPPVHAAFYQWTDAQGVVHLTDERDAIPKKYQGRAKRLELPDEGAPPRAAAPVPQTPAQASAPAAPGLHDESWWRQRFAALRGELKALKDALPQKQVKLAELRRERRIFVKARDREAVNALEAEISADELRISELLNGIDALEQDAARAGVPAGWRR